MAVLKVGINGFGRIGRLVFRAAVNNRNIEFVGINDLVAPETLAYLLKYDSTHGAFPGEVEARDNGIIVNNRFIPCTSIRNPSELPWGEIGADYVVEATGRFTTHDTAKAHLEAGAKRVIISAPTKSPGEVQTFLVGVNHQTFNPNSDRIVSNAGCTTNCLAPIAKVINDNFGIVKGTMTTTHSYTGDQRILDASHRDLRRARAAAVNIVPTTTGAAKAVALVIPEMAGKLNGIALRVPTPNVSIVDLLAHVSKKTITEELNEVLKNASETSMKGILGYTDEPLVSVDFRKTNVSATIDSQLSLVMDGDMIKVIAWYDNEWGYSQRVVDLAELVTSTWEG